VVECLATLRRAHVCSSRPRQCSQRSVRIQPLPVKSENFCEAGPKFESTGTVLCLQGVLRRLRLHTRSHTVSDLLLPLPRSDEPYVALRQEPCFDLPPGPCPWLPSVYNLPVLFIQSSETSTLIASYPLHTITMDSFSNTAAQPATSSIEHEDFPVDLETVGGGPNGLVCDSPVICLSSHRF
jgi:hypothetical protein